MRSSNTSDSPVSFSLLDSSHDWVVPLYSEHLVGNLVELLHLALSQQCAEFLYILSLLKGTCNREFLLFLLCLVAVVVPDGDVLPTVLLLLLLEGECFRD